MDTSSAPSAGPAIATLAAWAGAVAARVGVVACIMETQDNFNFVRDSRFLPNATEINLDSIYVERDKELNCTGNRLLDQRRFKRWHLPAGTWQYLPITVSERSRNPNLK